MDKRQSTITSSAQSRGITTLRNFRIRSDLDDLRELWRAPLNTVLSSQRPKVRCKATILVLHTVRASARLHSVFFPNSKTTVVRLLKTTSDPPCEVGRNAIRPGLKKSPRPKQGWGDWPGRPTVCRNGSILATKRLWPVRSNAHRVSHLDHCRLAVIPVVRLSLIHI